MKKLLVPILLNLCLTGFAQPCWWVFLTDKAGTTFDPYTYFDAKAIERYRLNHADLWDSSNYPLNDKYVQAVCVLATEEVGQSRWLNAVAVVATDEQVAGIARLPFVRSVRLIESELQLASCDEDTSRRLTDSVDFKAGMTVQLLRMQGELFREKGIDGRGIRIAVLDAGFLHVDSHDAFKHLRDSNRIVATWNFYKNNDNVYDEGRHGTAVLSCITGVIDTIDTMQLGLATGSEFLLARTLDEEKTSLKKDEARWIQAVEWADRNGADIISSSVGYGYGYYSVKQMDGTSAVARAANMAARKGILVCQAAANLGGEKAWKTIVTPADADSVLTVGGILGNIKFYGHANTSSYGPTADGRLKPNVCNFYFVSAVDPESDYSWSSYANGTSFSTPLTAGFCACAWQMNRSLTAMQLKAEVERSADLYPYYDYALGYGVPQASYFTHPERRIKDSTFVLEDSAEYILFKPLSYDSSNFIFLHVRDSNGLVEKYRENSFGTYMIDSINPLLIPKSCIGDRILCVCYNGYVSEFRLNDSDRVKYRDEYRADEDLIVQNRHSRINYVDLSRTLADNKIRWWAGRHRMEVVTSLSLMAGMKGETDCSVWSPSVYLGFAHLFRTYRNWYYTGFAYGYSHTCFSRPAQFGMESAPDNSLFYLTALNEFSMQLFQRIGLAGMFGDLKGLFCDFGLYGSFGWTRDKAWFRNMPGTLASKQVVVRPDRLEDYRWNYGVMTRIGYRGVGISASYRLNGLMGDELRHPDTVLPRLMLGVSYFLH
ncbi:MAG: S8 family serine peptidase [Bacteroidales bacterium]|nr:S8 family serine peptidase [Bacteroidales bacterium]MBR4511319.1 S8 family serine peptidase [Bacteroidales bacterium]